MKEQDTTQSRITALIYATAALPLAAIGVTFHVYLPKVLIDGGIISATFVGSIFIVARIWDAVLDPLMGHISDNYRFFGYRRKIWFIASIPFAVSAVLLTSPSNNLSFAISAFVFFLLWTAVVVPYEALGAEWNLSDKQRLRLFSFREGAFIIGTLLAAAIPAILESSNQESLDASQTRLLMIFYSLFLIFSLSLCALKVQESKTKPKAPTHFKQLFTQTFQNKPFLVLTLAAALHNLAAAIPATLVLFFVEIVLQSSNGSIFLCVYFLTGVLFLPLWNRLAQKSSALKLLRVALLIQSVSFFAVTFIDSGSEIAFAILVAISGIGYGGTLALFSTLLVSCVDYGEEKLNVRQEGGYIGIWSVVKKGAIALGSGLGLLALGLSEYVPSSTSQSDNVVLTIRVMYAGLPLLLTFLSLAILSKFHLPAKSGEAK